VPFPVEFQAFAPSIAIPPLAHLVLLLAYIPSRDTLPTCEAMHTLLSTRLTRAALKAARPARRHVVRALRHHATRTRALGEQWREAKAVDGIRTWFHTLFSALARQFASFLAAYAAAQTDAAAPHRYAPGTGRSAAEYEPPPASYVDERQHRLVCVRIRVREPLNEPLNQPPNAATVIEKPRTARAGGVFC
jgi:hypothetical protein